MDTIITPVNVIDIKQLQEISYETFQATFGPYNETNDVKDYLRMAYNCETLSLEIKNPKSYFFFIKKADQVAGYLKVNFMDAQIEKMSHNLMEIQRIYVRERFKRQHLGNQLMQFAIQFAKDHHKSGLWLGVWEYNSVALKFYRQHGFKVVGDHVFKMGNKPQRDLIMQKKLN